MLHKSQQCAEVLYPVDIHSLHLLRYLTGRQGTIAKQPLSDGVPILTTTCCMWCMQGRRVSNVCLPPLEYEASAELQQELEAAAPDEFICPMGRYGRWHFPLNWA